MRCSSCGERAFEKFRGRYYCRECFVKKYEGAVESAVRRYGMIKKNERILAALSGGKDSVAMLTVLKSLSEKLNFKLEALFIHLGIEGYSDRSLEISKRVSDILDVRLNMVRVEDYGFRIDDVKRKTCSVCGNVKRYLLNRFARENGFNLIATGHCAEDILANMLKNMYSGNVEWSEKQKPRIEGFDKIVGRIRPLYEMSERENLLYVLARKMPFVSEECPHTPSTVWKEVVYDIEKRIPGFRVSVLRNLAKERKVVEKEYRYCKRCGEITTSTICQFCRNVMRYSRKS